MTGVRDGIPPVQVYKGMDWSFALAGTADMVDMVLGHVEQDKSSFVNPPSKKERSKHGSDWRILLSLARSCSIPLMGKMCILL